MYVAKEPQDGLRKPGNHPATKRTRVVSMPPVLTQNSTRSSYYGTETSRFSGSGSPPIIDFTEWADNFRGQRFGFNIPNEYPADLTKKGPHALLPGDVKGHGHGGWRIDYEVLLDALRPLLEAEHEGVENYLDLGEIAALHQRDQDSIARRFRNRSGEGGNSFLSIDGVIGKPLADVFTHASLSLPIAGTEHFLPTIVVNCVEELYRTGKSCCDTKTPSFRRVEELVDVYDHERLPRDAHIARRRSQHAQKFGISSSSGFGAQTSLHLETTENICALLRTFLQYLPEPVLSPCLFEAIWNWCGVYQEIVRPSFDHSASMSRTGSSISSEELVRIYMAQILLHLLPTPNFSLLVYLLSFFSQVIMVGEENGLVIDDVGSMFGVIVFGGTAKGAAPSTRPKPSARGDIMMRWFLRRWRQIHNGLFPYDDDGEPSKSGVNCISPVRENGNGSVAMTRPMSGYFGLKDPPTISSHDKSPPIHEIPEGQSNVPPASSNKSQNLRPPNTAPCPILRPNPTGSATSSPRQPDVRPTQSQEPTLKYLEEVWPNLTSELRIKLNERMLDVMLEPLLSCGGSQMTRQRSNSVPTRLHSASMTQGSSLQYPLDLTGKRLGEGERSSYESRRLVQTTLDENQRVRRENVMLEMRVKALEVELELRDTKYKDSEERWRRGLEETVEGVVRERDEAVGIVSEIQRISGSVNGRRCGAGIVCRN
ncbi:hypothetical protein P691DRAFT_762044 [Macrolepiota fuliginosa MF-IS2]|uniref:Rho-GAP domain-containing protein n=1 Tax=Macrolepiota fuliginosa MF-IS2 TaxID=1400762 RepID=A0A9P6BZX6_9AGAR|nr:hypothetical protein P691DRAFT_762044 [Macrolepiota fuliginosa MF-IS2]